MTPVDGVPGIGVMGSRSVLFHFEGLINQLLRHICMSVSHNELISRFLAVSLLFILFLGELWLDIWHAAITSQLVLSC